MIRVHDFHKAYDRTVAVQGLSFEVLPGQICGLVGPNGAGKTTTLRALAGILPPTRGRLEVAGHDVEQDPLAAKLRLAYVPDDPQLFWDLTVDEHLGFVSRAYHVADADAKAADLLRRFELTDKRRVPARQLSRGMRQKLALCCAYLHDPQVLLLDEPLTGLDPHGIRTLKRTVVERAGQGAAVIVSSHLLAMVEDLCTHVLVLEQGQGRCTGPLAEVRRQLSADARDASLEEVFFQATSGCA